MGFVDTDLMIQAHCGETLQRVIDARGSDAFIEVENAVLREVVAANCVIATGGSAVYSREGMAHLREIGMVVYLRVSFESLRERLEDFDERGIVMRGNVGGLRELYDERAPLYEQCADVTVDVDGLSITGAARKVAAAVS